MCETKQKSPLTQKGNKFSAFATASMLASLVTCTFAAGTDLSGAIVSLCNKIGSLLTTIFGPLCILILGVAIITIMIGKNSKSAESGMDWAKRACICFVVFNLLGAILTWGLSLFSGTNVSGWGNVTDNTGFISMLF